MLLVPPMAFKLPSTASLPNPTAYWKFDEGSGSTAADSSGNGYTLSSSGATWVSGKFVNGVNTSDNGKYWTSTASGLLTLGLTSLTAAVWYNSTNTTNGSWGKIISFNTDVGFSLNVFRSTNDTPQMRIWIGGSESYAAASSTYSITNPTGVWNHVCGVYDGSSITLYINGVKRAQQTGVSGTIGGSPTTFYVGNSGGNVAAGCEDELRLYYNIAFSSSQVTTLYNLIP